MLVFLTEWLAQTWLMVLEAAPWLFGGFLLAGLVHALVPVEGITHHLGKPGWVGVLKASLIGTPLPLCSCSVIPVAASIRRQGATKGAFTSFLISTPETGVDSIAISYALLGPVLAVARPLAALITALSAGWLVDRFDSAAAVDEASNATPSRGGPLGQAFNGRHGEQPLQSAAGSPRGLKPAAREGDRADESAGRSERDGEACGCAGDCREGQATGEKPGRLGTALRFGLLEMYADLAPYLIAGFLLAGLASALIPEGFFERYIGTGLPAMLVMIVVGLPLYVCATSSTPVAAALIAGGLSPGAALVLLLVGPATNITTMLVVARDLGRRGLFIYLVAIVAVALGFGFLTNAAAASWTVTTPGQAESIHGGPGGVAWFAAVLLTILTLNGLRLRLGWVGKGARPEA